jgi:arginyl-tRNA--protein-N-Asp/Glu arginylyltransferase
MNFAVTNFNNWRNYSTLTNNKKKSLDQNAKIERQSKLVEELKERLKKAELKKEKYTAYHNYISQRKSRGQRGELTQ